MFGLERITWADFICLIACIVFIWYLGVLFYIFWKSRNKTLQNHFEEDHPDSDKELQAIQVLAKEFPSELIVSLFESESIGISSVYEEIDDSEGYGLETLENGTLPVSLKKTTNELLTQQK